MTFDQWATQEYALLLAQRDERAFDIKRMVEWWWANHQRDFFDYGAGDDMWMELAEKYGIELPPPISAVEKMYKRWEEDDGQ